MCVMDKLEQRAKYGIKEPGKLPKPPSATERRLMGIDRTYNTAHAARHLIVRGTQPENMYDTAVRLNNKSRALNPIKPTPIFI